MPQASGMTLDEDGNVIDQPEGDVQIEPPELNQPDPQNLQGGGGYGAFGTYGSGFGGYGGGLSTVGGEAKPDWYDMPPDQYLSENPPIDFHSDPHATAAIMPESPNLPWYIDKGNPEHLTRAASLLRLLAFGAMGAAAGAGSRTVGEGFSRGQMASYNLQKLQEQRQQAKEEAAWRQAQMQHLGAQTQLLQAQTAGIPQQQATLQDYRRARTQYLGAQSQKLQAQAAQLQRGPNDRLLHSYQGSDHRMHFLFQSGNSSKTYDVAGGPFYEKPQPNQRPVLTHGPDGAVYVVDPEGRGARRIIQGKDAKPRVASPGYFAHVEEYKMREWNKIQNNYLLSDEEKVNRLDDLQQHYEALIRTGGGTVDQPYDVRSGTRASAPELNAPKGQSFWSQVPGAVQRHP